MQRGEQIGYRERWKVTENSLDTKRILWFLAELWFLEKRLSTGAKATFRDTGIRVIFRDMGLIREEARLKFDQVS